MVQSRFLDSFGLKMLLFIWVQYRELQAVEVDAAEYQNVDELIDLIKQRIGCIAPIGSDLLTLCISLATDDGSVVLTAVRLA